VALSTLIAVSAVNLSLAEAGDKGSSKSSGRVQPTNVAPSGGGAATANTARIESTFDRSQKTPVGRFKDQQGGFSLGGPIVQN